MKFENNKNNMGLNMKYFSFFLLGLFNIALAQSEAETKPFSKISYGFFGGINACDFSNLGADFSIELNSNLAENFNLLINIGYSKIIEPLSYTVKINSVFEYDNITYYQAESYDVINHNYGIFPLAIGCKYIYTLKTFSPYLISAISYNLIDAKTEKSPSTVWSYDSYEEIPDEFKNNIEVKLPNNSFNISIGAGTVLSLTKSINIDLRYIYKIDSEIVNTHHINVGFIF